MTESVNDIVWKTRIVKAKCPKCKALNEQKLSYIGNPRSTHFKCFYCGEEFWHHRK